MSATKHPLLFYSLVWGSIALSLPLLVLPLPYDYQILRPELLCLLLIYWTLTTPQHVGISLAFIVGLMQDIIEQGVWGIHALSLAIISYICLNSYRRIAHYSIWQQSFWVTIFIGLHQMMCNAMLNLIGDTSNLQQSLPTILISALLWPLLLHLLQRIRRQLDLL